MHLRNTTTGGARGRRTTHWPRHLANREIHVGDVRLAVLALLPLQDHLVNVLQDVGAEALQFPTTRKAVKQHEHVYLNTKCGKGGTFMPAPAPPPTNLRDVQRSKKRHEHHLI